MKYSSLAQLIFSFLLGLFLCSSNIALAQQKENEQALENNKSADSYLQEGHKANRNGDIEKAITLYKKALVVKPGFYAAENSLESALSKLELQKWATKTLPSECQISFGTPDKCIEEYFSIYGEPIHPKIIQTLNTWLSDAGDQIVSINLSESQGSNRFCCSDDIKVRDNFIYYKEDRAVFGYQYIGKTESGIHVLYISDSGGGSGVFTSIMLVTLISDHGVVFDEEHSIIKANKQRLLIKKLGEVVLGDRWSGNLTIDGDNLIIGKDKGWYAGTDGGGPFSKTPRDRVIKIDLTGVK